MKPKRKKANVAPADMTPMLDVVFILLIFFVVTASFVHENGLLPHRAEGPPTPPPEMVPNLTFELLHGYRIRHEGRLIDVWSAQALIKRFHVEHTDLPISIRLLEGAKHGTLVRMIDVAQQSGVPARQIIVL